MDTLRGLFFNETTGYQPVTSRPEPSYRGTYGILAPCIITLLLCVWTAIRLNIPTYASQSEQTYRKAGWLILALLAPEMVAFTAWYQRKAAEKLSKEMRQILGQSAELPWWKRLLCGFADLPKGIWKALKKILPACAAIRKSFTKLILVSGPPVIYPMQRSIYGEEGRETIRVRRHTLLHGSQLQGFI
jgi:hypothetical protein